jgi:hypothetical protein
MKLIRKLFPWFAKTPSEVMSEEDLRKVADSLNSKADPLDVVSRGRGKQWGGTNEIQLNLRSVTDFPEVRLNLEPDGGIISYVGDSAKKEIIEGHSMDSLGDMTGQVKLSGYQDSAYSVPDALAGWYVNQSFIGYQMCAIIAQHWLVDKACSQSVEDAVRNGWTYKPDKGHKLTDDQKTLIDDFDKGKMPNGGTCPPVKSVMMEAGRFANIFGIRVLIFVVESDDKDYYTKPFNPDGIKKGSYKGISQIDPYWMTPMLTNDSMQNPANINFYEPDYWIINGTRYHRSHLVILRGPQPADILKPTYIFGGIPLTQRIYERVYAAERTANEAPLLAMNKRTTAIHVDLDKVAANEAGFVDRLLLWVKYRDNHAVKVLGKEEVMEQFDTSLSDFDSVIMNQYQIVAAQAKTPATKILGTSPKGFNATGEFETVSYHEELESIQERWDSPILDRHYLCLSRSLGLGFGLTHTWEPVDAMSAEKQAEVNSKKVNDAIAMAEAGFISPDEGRDKIAADKDSGWNNLMVDDDANTEKGATPENIAELEKAGAEKEKAGAEEVKAGNEMDTDPYAPKPGIQRDNAGGIVDLILARLNSIEAAVMPEGAFDSIPQPTRLQRSVQPTTTGAEATTQGIGSIVPALPENKLPRVKVGGMVCCIENPRSSIRQGYGLDGLWQVKMPHHYGYLKGTTGADGEGIDCFIGPNPAGGKHFIVNQIDPSTGEFDEHKVMIGFDSVEDAEQGYMDSFSDGWKGFGSIHPIAMDALVKWSQQPQSTPYGSVK